MTDPRDFIEGTTYMVTHRCVQREFLLRPSTFLNDAVQFLVAHAAETFSVQVHAICVLSNHFHLIVTDPYNNLSFFMHWIDTNLVRMLNAYYGRWESLLVRDSYHPVKLIGAEAVLDKMAYVLANPVEAGLVAYGAQWPGVRTSPRRVGRPQKCERPRFFFRKNGPVRPSATLEIVKPPALNDISDKEYVQRLEAAVAEREAAIRERFAKAGRKFLGAKRVLAQSIYDRPKTHAPRRNLKPHVACRDKWMRIIALEARKQFLQDYRAALKEFCARLKKRSGDAFDVVFPRGTFWMRVRYGVRCIGSPAPS